MGRRAADVGADGVRVDRRAGRLEVPDPLGIQAAADDDAHVPEARLVESRPDLQHQVRGHAATLGGSVEADAVEPVAERVRDAQRLLRLVLEGVDEHDARHVR